MDNDVQKYEKGKQNIALIINVFVLLGFVLEILSFHKLYDPLQFKLQILSVCVFSFTFLLYLVNSTRYYKIAYLVLSYFLMSNIVIYDILFPEFIEKLNFAKSEFFSRNLFFLFPLIATVGFISSKRHIVIQSIILILYIIYQVIWNNDDFIRASTLNYIMTTAGFAWICYFLVASTQRFIKELNDSNLQLKNTQQHLVQSEKMASLGILTAGVAHEINNPLNFIQGGVTGLEQHYHENNQDQDEDVALYLSGIKTGIERVSEIVKGLNQFNRDSKFVDENCNIHSIIDQSVLMLQTRMNDSIQLNKNFTPEPFNVSGNVGRLHQVFLNILTNACQSIKDEGTITISTAIEKEKIIIEIMDTGCGIEPDEIKKVTEPFYTTKMPGEGTGLGLSISYAIINDHKGDLSFQSAIGKGTTVRIALPISR